VLSSRRLRLTVVIAALTAAGALSVQASAAPTSSVPTIARRTAAPAVLPPQLTGYVALGDSYSAGEGAGNYLAGGESENGCDQSSAAYAVDLDLDEPLGALTFAACRGGDKRSVHAGCRGRRH
jgi:hypothetical protein